MTGSHTVIGFEQFQIPADYFALSVPRFAARAWLQINLLCVLGEDFLMATDNRFELAVGVGGGTGKDLVRSVFQAGDARYVRRMFGYGRADPLYQSGRLWRGTGTRAR